MLKKKALFILFISLALLMAGYLVLNSKFFKSGAVDAGSFGISPPFVNAGDIHPGESYSQVITLMRGSAESGELIETKIKADDFADWLNYEPEIAYFSKGEDTITIRVTLNVPTDAYSGVYHGDIIFGIEPVSRKNGVGIALGAHAKVSFTVKTGRPKQAELKNYQAIDSDLYRRLAGKILLVVDDHGKAYYVKKDEAELINLDNYAVFETYIKENARGISRQDLWKIPLGMDSQTGADADNDGLADNFEEALGTDKYSADSDEDGFNDAEEIRNGFVPVLIPGLSGIDLDFAQKQAGYFFIAAENRGEIWFVSVRDNKRYLIASQPDLLKLVRKTGVGILNNNFDKLIKSN